MTRVTVQYTRHALRSFLLVDWKKNHNFNPVHQTNNKKKNVSSDNDRAIIVFVDILNIRFIFTTIILYLKP